MGYLIGLWLVGVVITSLYILYRLRGEVVNGYQERVNMIICTTLTSVLWFISMPYLWYEIRKINNL